MNWLLWLISAFTLLSGIEAGRSFEKKQFFWIIVSIILGVMSCRSLFFHSQTIGFGKIAQEIVTTDSINNHYRALKKETIYETVKSTEVDGKTIAFIRNRKDGELLVYEFAKEPPKFFVKTNDKENPYLAVNP